jgi:branched-subunit amino acid ABC-type transport system permease component
MQILAFGVLGLASGAIYALLAQGIVLIYRGCGLLNFAQGAMAMVGGYTYYEVGVRLGAPLCVGLLAAVILSATLGAAIHLVILRPMHAASSLSKVMATLGVLITLQSLAYLLYGP